RGEEQIASRLLRLGRLPNCHWSGVGHASRVPSTRATQSQTAGKQRLRISLSVRHWLAGSIRRTGDEACRDPGSYSNSIFFFFPRLLMPCLHGNDSVCARCLAVDLRCSALLFAFDKSLFPRITDPLLGEYIDHSPCRPSSTALQPLLLAWSTARDPAKI